MEPIMIFKYFKIAGYRVRIGAEFDVSKYLLSFPPFVTDEGDADIDVAIFKHCDIPQKVSKINSYNWFECVATLYSIEGGFLWERVDAVDASHSVVWWNEPSPREFTIFIGDKVSHYVLEHLLLITFNYATVYRKTLILHSSVVIKDNGGYMFLGESGTGKSTHSRLWLDNIEGTVLLNDDAPVVRVEDGSVVVYGSPWSGKGACYRNECAVVKGFYRLSQAPYNKLHSVNSVMAFSSLISSCMPSLMEVEYHTDCVCDTLSIIIPLTSCFHLECLPNADAAMVSYNQLLVSNKKI